VTGNRVAVVVLNWNGWEDSLACLGSLTSSVKQGIARLIIVDNASTDGSADRIRDWLEANNCGPSDVYESDLVAGRATENRTDSNYVLIRARRNGGYSVGNNLGIRWALKSIETEYVFLLNNDTVIDPDSIARLAACADSDETIGIVGSTLVEGPGSRRIAGGNRFNLLLTTSTPVIAKSASRDVQIDFVTGAAQFIRASSLRKVGILSEDYFLYFEELDLTRRITKAGYRIAWCPEATVYHTPGRSTGSRSPGNRKKSALAEYHSNLSCLIFMRKFHPRLFWIAGPIRFVLKMVNNLMRRQPALVEPLMRAYLDYWALCRKDNA
jgi:GT2 family glycosyltransferase